MSLMIEVRFAAGWSGEICFAVSSAYRRVGRGTRLNRQGTASAGLAAG